ncbi:hypothetical protein [Salinibacter pepae]|uniref:hypothetical protein n=1 Tax=Salinibacter pepae TaxID=3040382 RepID=UPI0021E81754|nr:hypothetical protein [Salinibacter pepae]
MRFVLPSVSSATRRSASLLVLLGLAVCLLGAGALGPVGVQAQPAQVEQVESTTEQVESATQSQIFVVQDEGGVSRTEVENLTMGLGVSVPRLPDVAGNSAVIVQDGNQNAATIEQVGTNNRASAAQVGDRNKTVITQGGGDPSFSDGFSEGASAGEVFDKAQDVSPTGSGSDNLAVAVHSGSKSRTSITQLGSRNAAGIRLVGNQTVNLIQNGDANRFLMDTQDLDPEGLSLRTNVVQNGNGNSLETNIPVDVQMNGNGIEMVVLRGTPLPADLGS